MRLVYIHIGTDLPEYLFDSVYQTLTVCGTAVKVYVILHDSLIDTFNQRLLGFNVDTFLKNNGVCNVVQCIPISVLETVLSSNANFNNYKKIVSTKFFNQLPFRDGFWISTTSRFFYIYGLMTLFKIHSLYHIENDVMLYDIQPQLHNLDCITVVKDAPGRVIPSILFFPSPRTLEGLLQYISNTLQNSMHFMNDMELLGSYTNTNTFETFPNVGGKVYDGAAIGQFLGGVDLKNVPEYNSANDSKKLTMCFNNPTARFVNETSTLKPNAFIHRQTNVRFDHCRVGLRVFVMRAPSESHYSTVQNLHIHSKQLYSFSSVLTTKYDDIITGDRVVGLADFVLCTSDILQFHKGLKDYAKDILLIRDFQSVNLDSLQAFFYDHIQKHDTHVIKLFVYTHILSKCVEHIFNKLPDKYKFVIYLHNSDHPLDATYKSLVESKNVKHIYAQNPTYTGISNKITLLPIGIANSMWPHGDILSVYDTLRRTYKNKKTRGIYVNINPGTFGYRKEFLDKIRNKPGGVTISGSKPYSEYLEELAQHRFCLCLRGNGVDTHRFWEALYLGVIPVIVNNTATDLSAFVKYLEQLDVPFYEIRNESLDVIVDKYNDAFFDETLYNELAVSDGNGIYNLNALKLEYYAKYTE